jgi:pantoate--beta-alanine ligase
MSVEVIGGIAELRARLAARRREAHIGFVPTMGALHAGHGSLMERAAAETGCVVASVYVNPTQFNDARDFERYPRTLEQDAAFCAERGVEIVFAPSNEEMYPAPLRSHVEVEGITAELCGRFRPGHFRGVTTVVMKLLQIVQPDAAYFGEKDAQQLAAIRRMVLDLNVAVEIVGVPTVREADGLAMSSRNGRLGAEERRRAPALYAALCGAAERIRKGEKDAGAVCAAAEEEVERAGMRVEYLEMVDEGTMQPVGRVEGPVLAAAAVWLGEVRLIDNVRCRPGYQ